MPLSAPATILTLQRGAGNAAVSRLLQRCGSGGCTCGGTCAESDPKEVDYSEAAMTASVMVKSALNRVEAARPRRSPRPRPPLAGPSGSSATTCRPRGPARRPAGNEIQTGATSEARGLESRARSSSAISRSVRPVPDADGRTLTEAQVQAALRFNNRVVAVDRSRTASALSARRARSEPGAGGRSTRTSSTRSCAGRRCYRLGQDGQLGPASARPVVPRVRCRGDRTRRGRRRAPRTRPTGTIAPPVVGGHPAGQFPHVRADFAHDPANGIYASCCEIRQHIRWDAASAAAMPGGPPARRLPGRHRR